MSVFGDIMRLKWISKVLDQLISGSNMAQQLYRLKHFFTSSFVFCCSAQTIWRRYSFYCCQSDTEVIKRMMHELWIIRSICCIYGLLSCLWVLQTTHINERQMLCHYNQGRHSLILYSPEEKFAIIFSVWHDGTVQSNFVWRSSGLRGKGVS